MLICLQLSGARGKDNGGVRASFDYGASDQLLYTALTFTLIYLFINLMNLFTLYCGGVDPIPCVSTHRISDPRSGPAQLPPHTSSSAATPTGSVHKSQTVSVVGMSGQLKRCNESWFGSLQSGQFAAGWLAGSILCR